MNKIIRDFFKGYCLSYSDCHFPFYYNKKLFTNCISGYLSPQFCSTTFNFDKDKSWSHCPVTCDGFPEKDQKVISFRYLNHKKPCVLKTALHRINGLKIRNYVEPECQLEYSCYSGYISLYKEIECGIDGSFNKKAICVPEVRKLIYCY